MAYFYSLERYICRLDRMGAAQHEFLSLQYCKAVHIPSNPQEKSLTTYLLPALVISIISSIASSFSRACTIFWGNLFVFSCTQLFYEFWKWPCKAMVTLTHLTTVPAPLELAVGDHPWKTSLAIFHLFTDPSQRKLDYVELWRTFTRLSPFYERDWLPVQQILHFLLFDCSSI